jgi:hypothetical protein
MADAQTSEVNRDLHRSTWDHEIYADRSSEDEQLLIPPLLRKIKNTNTGGGGGSCNLKLIFCFMAISHEPLDLEKRSLQ